MSHLTASLEDINAALTLYVYCRDTISKTRHPDKDRKLLKQESINMIDSCISALRDAAEQVRRSQIAESVAEPIEASVVQP
jgi:hypothetical protein